MCNSIFLLILIKSAFPASSTNYWWYCIFYRHITIFDNRSWRFKRKKKHPWFFDVYQKDFLIFFKPWILTKGLEFTYPIFLFFIPLIILGSFLLLLKKMVYFQDLSKGQQFCGVCRSPIRVKISFLLMENIFCQIIDKFLKFLDMEYLIPYILIKHKNLSCIQDFFRKILHVIFNSET